MSCVVVTGFWDIPNKHGRAFRDGGRGGGGGGWLERTLRLNAPYVFFCDPAARPGLAPYRAGLPTTWADREMKEMAGLAGYDPRWVHPVHVPSPELALVWLNKMDLVLRASLIAPQAEWFAWVDAGLCLYRAAPPPASAWPRPGALDALPKDRMVYTRVSGAFYHSFAGTAWLMHRSIVPLMHRLFYEEVERIADDLADWRAGCDQAVWTRLQARRPELFHALGEGYGAVVELLA